MTTLVTDNPAEGRYEVREDGELAGFAAYQLSDGQIAMTHTEVDEAYAGKGLGKVLVTTALDDARVRGLSVVPYCSYVRKVITDSPDLYLDLVPESYRSRMGLDA